MLYKRLRDMAFWKRPCVRSMLILGFSSGLPLLLVLGTLSFRLREAGLDRGRIAHVSWVALAYGLKWVWAPLVDRVRLPWLTERLGRRRAWLLLSQVALALSLWQLGQVNPVRDFAWMVVCAGLTAFASATQDIALDAWRIEAVEASLQGIMAAAYQAGYRFGMIVAGAGVLGLTAHWAGAATGYVPQAWQKAYTVMAVLMLVGMLATLMAVEKPSSVGLLHETPLRWLKSAFVAPFVDFFRRYHRQALWILMLVALYRIADVVKDVMSNPFYVDMGYSKTEVAMVSKVYGVMMGLAGAATGGVLVARFGIMRILVVGTVLTSCGNLAFLWLSEGGHNVPHLVMAISADYFAGGIASSAFVAYLSSLINVTYSASQYALLSSAMLLLPKILAGFSGDFVNHYGYARFFLATAIMGIPVLLLIGMVARVCRGVRGKV